MSSGKSRGLASESTYLTIRGNSRGFAAQLNLRSLLLRDRPNSPRPQREALLHLVFPDSFERITSFPHKERIAKTFARFVIEPTEDVDRKLGQIRQGLEAERGDFDFYDDNDIRREWDSSPPNANGQDGGEVPEADEPPPPETPSLEELADELMLTPAFLRDVEKLLDDKRQIIFQGTHPAPANLRCPEVGGVPRRGRRPGAAGPVPSVVCLRGFCAGLPAQAMNGQAGFELRDWSIARHGRSAPGESRMPSTSS